MKQNIKPIKIIGILTFALLSCLLVFNIIKKTTVSKALESAKRFISTENYTEAISSFDKVIKFDKNNTEVRETRDLLHTYQNIDYSLLPTFIRG